MTLSRRLTLDNNTIEYRIVRSHRRKTSELFVDSRDVLVRTPAKKPINEIEKIIRAKANWIVRKQEQYRKLSSQITNPTFENGSLVPYLGKGYPLSIIISSQFKEDKIRFVNGEFLVSLKSSRLQGKNIHRLYNSWLQRRAQIILERKIRQYTPMVNATPKKIVVKEMKNRWGSATKSAVLNFNLNLLKAPEGVIDYIVLHELCHLKIRDHSHNFWSLVRWIMPDYRDRVEWLSSNASGLLD